MPNLLSEKSEPTIVINGEGIKPMPNLISKKSEPAIWLRDDHLPKGTMVWVREEYTIQNGKSERYIKIKKMTETEAATIDTKNLKKIL